MNHVDQGSRGLPESEPDPAGFSLSLAIALAGAVLCAVGVSLASLWLIGTGVAALIAASLVREQTVSLGRSGAGSDGATITPPIIVLWAGALAIAVSIFGLSRNFEAGWPLATWLGGLTVVVCAALYSDFSTAKMAWRFDWSRRLRSFDFWMLSGLFAAGLLLRVRELETLPPMHGDEGEMAMLALRVGSSDQYLPPFSTGFLDHPTLFHYLQKLSMALFGQSVSGVRMGSALFGALCIPAVYVVGRLGWSRRVGVIAAAFLAFSHIHIQFSRMALNNIHSVFMAIVMVAFVLWADRSLANRDSAILPLLGAGMSCGLAQYFYYGSRLLPVLLAAVVVVFAWRYRTQFRRLWLVPFGFFMAWLPLVPRYWRAPGTFASRQSGVSIFTDANTQAINADGAWGVLWLQTKNNLRFFVDGGDVSTFYFADAPGLQLLAAILFWVGLGLALARFLTFQHYLVVCWFVLGFVLGGILTNGAPSATRLVMVFPAVALFGGIAVDYFFGLVLASARARDWMRYAVTAVIALVLAQGGVRIYFSQFGDNPPRAHVDAIGRDFAEQAGEADTFLLGAPSLFAEHGTLRFMSYPDLPRNLWAAAELADQKNTRPRLFVVGLPNQEQELLQLTEQVPGGEYRSVRGPTGELLYFSYLVDH